MRLWGIGGRSIVCQHPGIPCAACESTRKGPDGLTGEERSKGRMNVRAFRGHSRRIILSKCGVDRRPVIQTGSSLIPKDHIWPWKIPRRAIFRWKCSPERLDRKSVQQDMRLRRRNQQAIRSAKEPAEDTSIANVVMSLSRR